MEFLKANDLVCAFVGFRFYMRLAIQTFTLLSDKQQVKAEVKVLRGIISMLRSLNLSLKRVRYGSISSTVLYLSQIHNGRVMYLLHHIN